MAITRNPDSSTFNPAPATPVRQEVAALIAQRLETVEQQENVRIILACESGSRAWGFPSQDSDYDVRFIYVHPKQWYLSIDASTTRDVIERPIEQDIDLAGWDLPKALRLLRKSNPPLLEWLASPIVYRCNETLAGPLRALAFQHFQPATLRQHYFHMAEGNYREYLLGELVPAKKYFYVLRAAMAALWVLQDRGPVPMEFDHLVAAIVTDAAVLAEIQSLLERKRAGIELAPQPSIQILNAFIEDAFQQVRAAPLPPRPTDAQAEEFTNTLNAYYRSVLDANESQ